MNHHGLIEALSPMVTGLPSTMAVVTALPRVLATNRVLPEADGVGFYRSTELVREWLDGSGEVIALYPCFSESRFDTFFSKTSANPSCTDHRPTSSISIS